MDTQSEPMTHIAQDLDIDTNNDAAVKIKSPSRLENQNSQEKLKI